MHYGVKRKGVKIALDFLRVHHKNSGEYEKALNVLNTLCRVSQTTLSPEAFQLHTFNTSNKFFLHYFYSV